MDVQPVKPNPSVLPPLFATVIRSRYMEPSGPAGASPGSFYSILRPPNVREPEAVVGQLLRAGDAMQDQSQNNLDFDYEQWQQQQDDPYKKLQAMTGVMSNTAGSTTTTKQSGGK